MLDTIRFYATGEPVFDPETGEYEVSETDVYEGKCQIVPAAISDRVVVIGETPTTLKLYKVYVPRSVTTIQEGHGGEVLASQDPALVGKRLFVKDVLFETHQPTRRVVAEYRHEDQEGS
jgi:hypothetical protein